MKPRVQQIHTSEVQILKNFSFQSKDYGCIAGVSKIIQDFLHGIRIQKPLKPRTKLDEEYPGNIRGVPENFQTDFGTGSQDFGTLRSVNIAQDEKSRFYLCFETEKGSYYIQIR